MEEWEFYQGGFGGKQQKLTFTTFPTEREGLEQYGGGQLSGRSAPWAGPREPQQWSRCRDSLVSPLWPQRLTLDLLLLPWSKCSRGRLSS